MSVTIKGKVEKIIIEDGNYIFTPYILDLYDNFNQEIFDSKVNTIDELQVFSNAIYDLHGQNRPTYYFDSNSMFDISFPKLDLTRGNDVLLGFSGGLDSCYLAILLREKGYNVHLFHCKNLNSYECNLSYTVGKSFAEKLNFDFIEATFCRCVGKDNKYKQFWEDNTCKNQLIYALMIDICINKGWHIVSLGDDRSMSKDRPDMTLGINSTDCREVQEAFEHCAKKIFNGLNFLLIDREINSTSVNKFDRLKKLKVYDVLDLYYSCVGAGRFNQYNHKLNSNKFKVNLPAYNCGCSCAKCATHNLLMHYSNMVHYPQSFIDKCWERLWNTKHGTIKALFAPEIPLEKKIDNLFRY